MYQGDKGTHISCSSFNRQFNPRAKVLSRKHDATWVGTMTYAISKKREK